jgi:hypothetical protein
MDSPSVRSRWFRVNPIAKRLEQEPAAFLGFVYEDLEQAGGRNVSDRRSDEALIVVLITLKLRAGQRDRMVVADVKRERIGEQGIQGGRYFGLLGKTWACRAQQRSGAASQTPAPFPGSGIRA